MPDTILQELKGVPETLFMTLYVRAMETRRTGALLKDEKAVELVDRMVYDFGLMKQVRMDEFDMTTLILRNLEFDRYARDFLRRSPEAVVVHIGCGLDSRFERVDNGKVEWYDLDVPEVMALRQKLIGGEGSRYHHLGCSAFDPGWIEQVKGHKPRPFLFLAEGVFMYFTEEQVKGLVLRLRETFPGCELVFDAFTPFLVSMNNLRFSVTKYGAMYHWGIKRGEALEQWAPGIQLLGQWSYFDSPEPRLDPIRWMKKIPFWAKVMSIFWYKLE